MDRSTLDGPTINGIGYPLSFDTTDSASASIVVSDYKWLTSTLKTAQQQPSLRPYFQCQIKDDLIVPTAILSSSLYPRNGSTTVAPDGSVLSAGIDSSGSVSFWKLSDASNLAQWATPTSTLMTTAGITSFSQVDIEVSQYINGTYRIDIYILYVSSATFYFKNYYSDDGGTTFSSNAGVSTATASSLNGYISAGQSYLDINNNLKNTLFFSNGSTITTYKSSNNFNTHTSSIWSHSYVDSYDWIIHSFDSYYDGTDFHIVFSGYHNYLENSGGNFSLYSTIMTAMDLWTVPKEILASLSSTVYNQNSFTYPRINFDGSYLWLLFKANLVSSISTAPTDPTILSTNVTTTINYMLCKSATDFSDFTYPSAIAFTDGTVFTDTIANNFYLQGSSYFISGNGNLWQYTQNNIVADITNDIISCSVQEQGGQANSISLQIGNQNGQWFGPSPTKLNYQAIAKDRKILIDIGYYNSFGIPETVPRNIFFIDDIQQNVTSNSNDLTITARDFYKHTSTTVSKYSYNFDGCSFYNDVFDGTTISNWNQVSGTWIQSGNAFSVSGANSGVEYSAFLSKQWLIKSNSIFSIQARLPTPTDANTEFTTIYAFYQDSNNWIRLRIVASTFAGYWDTYVETMANGSLTQIGAGQLSTSSGTTLSIIVRKSNYCTFNFIAVPGANQYNSYDASNLVKDWGNYDMSANFSSGVFTKGSVGFGFQNMGAGSFKYMKYMQYSESQNIMDLIKSISTKASIFNYVDQKLFTDDLFKSSYWNGTFSIVNRQLIISPSQLVMKTSDLTSTDFKISNGEVQFSAKLSPTDPSSDYSIGFVFRNQSNANINNSYIWKIKYNSTSGIVSSRFDIANSGPAVMMSSSSDVDYKSSSTFNDLKLNLKGFITYKLVMSDGWMHGFINGNLVISWNDNNVSQNYSTGYIGFQTDSNTTITVKKMTSSIFYNQVENYCINPGDDMETSIGNIVAIVRAWKFSDIMGRMKNLVLNSTDTPNYSYDDEIVKQTTDNSDKEYVNQVTVFGNGVSAVVQDSSSIASAGKIRDYLITDYKILTYKDALSRAQYELTNAKKFNNQSQPSVILNVGSEIFDPITVVNTGDNSSGVDSNLRVYNETFSIGGGNVSTSSNLSMETGNL